LSHRGLNRFVYPVGFKPQPVFAVLPSLRIPETTKDRTRAVEDVTQNVLYSIADSMDTFQGDTNEAFWKWCYRIARRRIADYVDKAQRDKLDSLPFDELLDLIDDSTHAQPLSAADRLDLNHALHLLSKSKPDCLDYLWNYYVVGFGYADIAEERSISYRRREPCCARHGHTKKNAKQRPPSKSPPEQHAASAAAC
jgi:RNA polymerase sigma factor (sigma-70 family)